MIQLASALVVAGSAARSLPRTLLVDGSAFAYGGAGPRGVGPASGCAGRRGLECALRPLSSCSMEDVDAAAAAAAPAADDPTARVVERRHLATLPVNGGAAGLPTRLRPPPAGVSPWQWLAAHRGYLHLSMSADAAAAVAAMLDGVDGDGAWPPACPGPLIGVHARLGDAAGTVDDGTLASTLRAHARLVVRAGAATGGRRVLLASDVDDPRATDVLQREVARAAAAAAAASSSGPYCVRAVPRRFAIPPGHAAGSSVASFLSTPAGAPHRWNATIDVLAAVEALSNAAALVGRAKSRLAQWIASVAVAKRCSAPGLEFWSVVPGDAGGGGPVSIGDLVLRNWADELEWMPAGSADDVQDAAAA